MDKPQGSPASSARTNPQDFILQCLEALTTQTLDPKGYEVIVVDNHSKDGTASLANRFIESHPQAGYGLTFERAGALPRTKRRGKDGPDRTSLNLYRR